MWHQIWECVKAIFRGVMWAIRSMASVWGGFGRLISKVFGFVLKVLPTGLALWKNSVSSLRQRDDGVVDVSTVHMKTDGGAAHNLESLSAQEFQGFNHAEASEQEKAIHAAIQENLRSGATVNISMTK